MVLIWSVATQGTVYAGIDDICTVMVLQHLSLHVGTVLSFHLVSCTSSLALVEYLYVVQQDTCEFVIRTATWCLLSLGGVINISTMMVVAVVCLHLRRWWWRVHVEVVHELRR